MTEGATPVGIELPLVWVGIEELPIQMVSQMMVQVQAKDEIILTLGQTSPPILIGTPEQQAAAASRIPFIPVRALVRSSLTSNRVREVIKALTDLLEKHDELFGSPKDETK
jgi:hypothetical protein